MRGSNSPPRNRPRSLPPCGGGLGRGVAATAVRVATPSPALPRKGGESRPSARRARAAMLSELLRIQFSKQRRPTSLFPPPLRGRVREGGSRNGSARASPPLSGSPPQGGERADRARGERAQQCSANCYGFNFQNSGALLPYSLPPCGGGLGRGVAATAVLVPPPPSPAPPRKGGREQTEREASARSNAQRTATDSIFKTAAPYFLIPSPLAGEG